MFIVLLAVVRPGAGRRPCWRQRRPHAASRCRRVLPVMRRSPLALVRHLPLLLFLAGVPFFALALADPHTGFAREEVSYPGRRIALLVDALHEHGDAVRVHELKTPGRGDLLHRGGRRRAVHRRRMNGRYHDLVALIQFGN